MNPNNDSVDPRLRQMLDRFQAAPARDAQVAARARARFLAEADSLAPGVSRAPMRRLIGWTNLFQRKERFRMSTLTAVLVLISLIFGGSGATVVAAQSAQPADPLYAVKLLSEDLRVDATSDSAARANLLLDLANRRADEIAALNAQSAPLAAPVMARQQAEIENALQIVAGMDDATMTRELDRARDQLQQQLQLMDRLSVDPTASSAPILDRERAMLTTQLALMETGLQDPQRFRAQMRERERMQFQQITPSPTAMPSPQMTTTPQATPLQEQQQMQPTPQQQQMQVQPTPPPPQQAQPTPQQQQQQMQPTPQQQQMQPTPQQMQMQPTPQQQQQQQRAQPTPQQQGQPTSGQPSSPGGNRH